MLTLTEARERILEGLEPTGSEEIPTSRARGRVTAAEIRASRALPPWDNSAMDGYAVRSKELPGTLPVSGTVAAGQAAGTLLPEGTCMKIMTGAPVPDGADAVVMRENVEVRGDSAVFAEGVPVGKHIRYRGEDVAEDSVLLGPHTQIGPGEIALLAAQGHDRVSVFRRPRVAVLSTGDELVPLGHKPSASQIINSNNPCLCAQIEEAGAQAIDAGIVGDTLEDTVRAFEALQEYDVLITSGGVSVGDFDFVKPAYERVGVTMDFWKVAIKPGKPLAFGRRNNGQIVFGLPGNPASSLVSFELFVRPALLTMQGRPSEPSSMQVALGSTVKKSPGRAHYLRAQLDMSTNPPTARPFAQQGSGRLRSLSESDGLVELPLSSGDTKEGTLLSFLLMRNLR